MKVFPFLTPILLAPLITAHAQQEPALLSDPPDGSETPVPKVRAVFKPCVVEETTVTRQGGRDIIVQRLALDPIDPIKPVVPESPAAIPFDPAAAADFPTPLPPISFSSPPRKIHGASGPMMTTTPVKRAAPTSRRHPARKTPTATTTG